MEEVEEEEEEEDEEFRKLEINKNIDYGRIKTIGWPLLIVISWPISSVFLKRDTFFKVVEPC